MFKKISLLVSCCIYLMMGGAQNLPQARIDTALVQLSKARDDTNKVNLLRYVSSAYSSVNYNEGIKYGKQGLELAEKINWKSGIAKMYNSLGLNYSAKSDYSKAVEYYIKALKLNEELGNKKAVAGNLGNLANLYDGRSDYPKAIEYYLQAIEMFEESGDKIGAERNLVNLGNAYAAQPDYAKAIEIYLKALKLDEALGNKYGMTNSYTGISLVYSAQSDFPKALEYAFKALKVMEGTGDKVNIAESLTAVGVIYTNQHDYARALEYVFKALKTDEELGSKTDLSYNYGEIGYIYLTMVMDSIHKQPVKIFGGNKRAALQQAEIYLDSSVTVHKELGDLDNLKTIYENLSGTQALLKDYRGALETYKNYTLTKDSIFNTEKDKDLTQTAMNYEFGKKQLADSLNHVEENIANQAKLQRQKLFTYAGFAGLGLIGISLFFVFRNYRNQKKANIIISKEKDRSENLLLNILPAEVAEELKETGSARAKSFDQVTVLFTDFKGFTLLSERLSPEQLVGEINYCFSGFDNIISKYGIEKIKTIGDSYMCAGGLPVKNTTHAVDVVSAGLEIRDFMLAYKKEKEASGGIPFEIRIGVNTGALVAGIVGVKKFAYDIWGDAVNIASRMESSGEVGKVNISETTYELVKDKFNCEYRGEVEAKNKGKLKMYFVEQS